MPYLGAPDIAKPTVVSPEDFIYCNKCRYKNHRDQFPLSGPAENIASARFCPQCTSRDLINLADLRLCAKCDENPPAAGEKWCVSCNEDFEMHISGMYAPGE